MADKVLGREAEAEEKGREDSRRWMEEVHNTHTHEGHLARSLLGSLLLLIPMSLVF